jgi:hypothetical protein
MMNFPYVPTTSTSLIPDDSELFPPASAVPREFRSPHNYWYRLASEWFFEGLHPSKLVFRADIRRHEGLHHLGHALRSCGLDHDTKIASVAYLMSLWCEQH